MKKVRDIFIFAAGAGAVVLLFLLMSYQPTSDSNPTTSNNNGDGTTADDAPQTHQVQKVRPPRIPDKVTWAGEEMPMDFISRERLEHELLSMTFRHSATLAYMKRANRYFPIIEPILEKNGVPDDIKYLAVTESELRNVVSPAGAAGFWQFMKSTGQGYGMEINDDVDERYNLEIATQAACEYLLKNKKKFGTWMLSAASYNMGGGRLSTRLEEQKEDTYFGLYLNRETSRYVPRILAIKEVMQNPETYGFYLEEEDLHPEMNVQTVEVKEAVSSWAEFAHQQGITYQTLRAYNPWIRNSKLSNRSKKTYEVKIPAVR